MSPLVLISPWFGPWPEWINFYLISCERNPEVTWLIPTDQAPPECQPPNVRYLPMTFGEFSERVSDTTGVRYAPPSAYKVCDIKPMLGHVFAEEIAGFRSWGFADHDVVWGDIRKVYTDELLAKYAAISSLQDRIAGHLSVFANTDRLRRAYRRRPGLWQRAIASPAHEGFCEGHFSTVFTARALLQLPLKIRPKLFVERDQAVDRGPLPEGGDMASRQVWTWQAGKLTNSDSGDRELLYLHFMGWRSNRYRDPSRGPAPWTVLQGSPVRVDWHAAAQNGFEISAAGFTSLEGRG